MLQTCNGAEIQLSEVNKVRRILLTKLLKAPKSLKSSCWGFFLCKRESCKHPNIFNASHSFQKITTTLNREGTTTGLMNLMWL